MSEAPARPGPALAAPPPEAAKPYPLRWFAAIVLISANLMDLLDVTIVNVALPTVQRDLGASSTQLEWVSAAYLLGFAAGLITGARLGDLWGRRRVFLAGVAAFGAASLACSAAQGPWQLIAARAVQGVAAAALAPQVLSTLQGIFQGRERGTVFGLFGVVAGLAQALGLLIGGLLVTADPGGLGWRAVFLVNVPVVVVVIVLALRVVPETRVEGASRPGLPGTLVLTGGLVAIVFPLLEGRGYGWPVWCWLCVAAGMLALAGLAFWERRRAGGRFAPLLPGGLFRIRSFSTALVVMLLGFAAFSGYLLVFILWLQDGQGYSALDAGLVTVAFCAGSLVSGVVSGRLTARFGRWVVTAGCLLFAVGLLIVLAGARGGLGGGAGAVGAWSLVPGLAVLGGALNLVVPPLAMVALAGVPPEHAGAASGLWSTAQQYAAALGVAVLASVFFSVLDGSAPGGGHRAAFTAVSVVAAAVLAGCAVLSLALGGTRRSGEG